MSSWSSVIVGGRPPRRPSRCREALPVAAVAGTVQRLPHVDILVRRAAGENFTAKDLGLSQQLAE
jgi:hypothetical protein